MSTQPNESPARRSGRVLIGPGVIGAWGLLSLLGHFLTEEVELAFRFRDGVGAFDGFLGEWMFRLFPGAVFPSYIAGVDLHGAIGTDVTYILHNPVVVGFGLIDGLTVLLVALAIVAVMRPPRLWTRLLVGITALHVIAHVSFVVFTASVPISFVLGSAIPLAGMLAILIRPSATTVTPSPLTDLDPTARVFAVQTPTGWSDWVSQENLRWLVSTGEVVTTSIIFDGRSQTSRPAGEIPGLF